MKARVHYDSNPSIFNEVNFTILVQDPCKMHTLAISTVKFGTPAATYHIRDTIFPFIWSDLDVTVTGANSDCGALIWDITKSDGTALDSTVFTSTTNQIDIYTTDVVKV